jgi:hypothetical protein
MEAVSPTLRCMGNRGVEQTWGFARGATFQKHWESLGSGWSNDSLKGLF